ncbi:MAG: hypothetical protein ACI9GW_000627 [Halieaceae bacterium]
MYAIIALSLTGTIIVLCVVIHYEILYRLAPFTSKLPIALREQIIIGVLLALLAHVLEIWIFGLGYMVALRIDGLGGFVGTPVIDVFDAVYFSFITYTTLGFGDIVPTGWLRFIVGSEAMTGLVQLAWTASYIYFQMQRGWGDQE